MKTIDRIVVIGAVGTALNILYQIEDAILNHNYPAKLEGIIIDDHETGSYVGDFLVIGSSKDIQQLIKDSDYKFIYCLYRMDKLEERFRLLESYNIPQERFVNFVHPLSYVSSDIVSGKGNVIMSNTSIQSGVHLGNNNIINSNITVEHNCSIGNGNFLSANSCIGSNVSIRNYCFIGLNSSVRENVILGDNAFIGMHSLVLKDFKEVTVAGVPAKITMRKPE